MPYGKVLCSSALALQWILMTIQRRLYKTSLGSVSPAKIISATEDESMLAFESTSIYLCYDNDRGYLIQCPI